MPLQSNPSTVPSQNLGSESILAWNAITADEKKNKVNWPCTPSNSLQHSFLFPWEKQVVHHVSSLKDSSLDLNINWHIQNSLLGKDGKSYPPKSLSSN